MSRYIFCLFTVALLLAGLGCNRYLDSAEPDQSLPDAPPTPINVQAQLQSQAVRLAWELSDSSHVSRFRVYVADSSGAPEYILRDSTSAYSLVLSGLLVNHRYYFRVATVGAGGIEGQRSTAISARVGLLALTINGGDRYTNRRAVTVGLVAPSGASHVILSEDPDLAGANPQSYASSVSFTLSDGDGLKTLYGRFVLGDGSQSATPVSDQIELDTRAAIDSTYFVATPAMPYKSGDVVTFRVVTVEPGGAASVQVAGGPTLTLYDDGANGDALVDDGIYTARYTVPTNLNVTNGSVTGSFTDAAGNNAPEVAASRLITIANPPLPVQFTLVEAVSNSEIDLNWIGSDADNFLYYRIYRNTTATVTSGSTLVKTITNRPTTNYSDTALSSDQTYYYRLFVYNQAGLKDSSTVASAKTPVDANPTPVVLAATYQDADSSALLNWTENQDRDFSFYSVRRGLAADTLVGSLMTVLNNASSTSFTDQLPDTQTYYYWVVVTDKAGHSASSNRVRVSVP